MNVKSYTFRIHPSMILKIVCVGYVCKLFKSVIHLYVFVRNCSSQCTRLFKIQSARAVVTKRKYSKTPKSCAIKQMANDMPHIIELWMHLGDC